MEPLSGKKIFVLYPDENLRDILYGDIRNRFEVYYIYDYEKVKPLVEYYPGSIIVLNLIGNDLHWLVEELNDQMKVLADDASPSIIALFDETAPPENGCSRIIQYSGNTEDLKTDLLASFNDYGGKGRRNFVRYGGSDENIASISLETQAGVLSGVVHDISVSGLSFSLSSAPGIAGGERLNLVVRHDDFELRLQAEKILERNFGELPVHVLKFLDLSPDIYSELLGFIYSSLDSRMNEFIKKLSS